MQEAFEAKDPSNTGVVCSYQSCLHQKCMKHISKMLRIATLFQRLCQLVVNIWICNYIVSISVARLALTISWRSWVSTT